MDEAKNIKLEVADKVVFVKQMIGNLEQRSTCLKIMSFIKVYNTVTYKAANDIWYKISNTGSHQHSSTIKPGNILTPKFSLYCIIYRTFLS